MTTPPISGTNVQTFENVTFYIRGDFFGNIHRTDVKELSIETGVRYAQYNNAIVVRFTKTRGRSFRITLDYKPFLVVLKRTDAFDPDEMLVPPDASGAQHSRYLSHDPRWQSDFFAQIAQRGITPLFSAEGHDAYAKATA
jgi:hypothetical protein